MYMCFGRLVIDRAGSYLAKSKHEEHCRSRPKYDILVRANMHVIFANSRVQVCDSSKGERSTTLPLETSKTNVFLLRHQVYWLLC